MFLFFRHLFSRCKLPIWVGYPPPPPLFLNQPTRLRIFIWKIRSAKILADFSAGLLAFPARLLAGLSAFLVGVLAALLEEAQCQDFLGSPRNTKNPQKISKHLPVDFNMQKLIQKHINLRRFDHHSARKMTQNGGGIVANWYVFVWVFACWNQRVDAWKFSAGF